jgi:hypothetical protein
MLDQPESKAQVIARLLSAGGVVLIAGAKGSNFPEPVWMYPQFVFWDTDESTADRLPTIPSNARYIFCLRFVRHHTTAELLDFSRSKHVAFEWSTTGEIKKILEEVIELRAKGLLIPRDPMTMGVPMKMTAQKWLREADDKGLVKWNVSYTEQADWLSTQARRDGVEISADTLATYLSALGIERGHRRRTSRDGVPPSAPEPKSEPPVFTLRDLHVPDAISPLAKPATSKLSDAATGDDDFAMLLKLIGDSVASLQLLAEFVEGLRKRTSKARERDARIRALLDEKE